MSLYARSMLFVMFGLLASCATPSPPPGKPLPAGYLYKGSFLNIHSPRQKGWYLSSASHAGLQFTRHGNKKAESFSAQVQTFPLPHFKNTQDMISFLKRGFEKDTRSARFSVIKSDFKVSHARKYPCVSVSAVIQDNQVAGSHAHPVNPLLQSYSLYCRHPVQELAGFAIIYSYRGKSLYPELKKQARAFMAGVQVPSH